MIFHMTLRRLKQSFARAFALSLTLVVGFGPNVASAQPAAPAAPPTPLEPPSPPAPPARPEAPTVGPVPAAPPQAAPPQAVPPAAPAPAAPAPAAPAPAAPAPAAPAPPKAVPKPAKAAPAKGPSPLPTPAPAAGPPPQTEQAAPPIGAEIDDKDPRALEQFRPQLDPYGAWADDPKYGRVWVPDRGIVGENFSPYVTAGHWALDTEDNYVWVSDYPFGDVVFHYGRWAWTSYGWSWVPGYQYAPAWVTWRVPTAQYAYVGWAPLAPGFIWMGGMAVSIWYPAPYYWVFCPSVYLFAPYPYHHIVTYPAYVRSVGAYTRHYVPANPSVGPPRGPPIAMAKIPPQALPAHRMPAGGSIAERTTPRTAMASPRLVSSAPAARPAPYVASSAPAVRPGPSMVSTPPSAASPRAFASPRLVGPPRSISSTDFAAPSYRGYNQGFTSPRAYSPTPGVYSPSAGTYSPSSSPRVYSPSSSPVYSPSSSPRVYSPSSYSPRVYSPSSSPHVYSPSAAPRVYTPASASPRMYSPSHTYSPSFGGARTYSGGGGHHR
jgi:hypothetical protein